MRQGSSKDTGLTSSESETRQQSGLTPARLSISSEQHAAARILAMPERARELPENVPACGLTLPGPFASIDPDTLPWRTSQRCWVEGWTWYAETWPRAGM